MPQPDPRRSSLPNLTPVVPPPQPVEPGTFQVPRPVQVSRHRSWPDNALLVPLDRLPKSSRPPITFFNEVQQPVVNLLAPIMMSCHCTRVRGTIETMPRSGFGISGKCHVDLNHDARGRKFSGQLAISYFPTLQPHPDFMADTVEYHVKTPEEDHLATVYFCPVCGCHLFKQTWAPVPTIIPGIETYGPVWGVATGVVTMDPGTVQAFKIGGHISVDQTGDGGLSMWMMAREDGTMISTALPDRDRDLLASGRLRWPYMLSSGTSPSFEDTGPDILTASCACGTVKFHITRPDVGSTLPKSQYPDLMIPYEAKSSRTPNDEDNKWWIRPPQPPGPAISSQLGSIWELGRPKNRYLAGTCACTSCRTCSGFNIQSWSFIPRGNIFMHLPDGTVVGLDFANMPPGILRSYVSSQGVIREFCPGCGATVFWHNYDRAELIDVSVGLFNARGARAEDWLDWWTDRVSFSEERFGIDDQGALWDPVTCLEMGMRRARVADI